jgi:uncharacterized protein YjhX (UPF0386 family)
MIYVKLVRATSGHGYEVECYSDDGFMMFTMPVMLAELDRLAPKHVKLRMKGCQWAIATLDEDGLRTVLPVSLPRFMRAG